MLLHFDPRSDIPRPDLDLDFRRGSPLDTRITFTRNGLLTYLGPDGLLKTAAVNEPAFNYNPARNRYELQVWEQRANLLLNSETLSTQTVGVSAVQYTLSFSGAGTIVLSGTHSATVVGAGDYPAKQTLTFTPTAGSLVLTVFGTVKYANLEAGAFATPWIPTPGTTATRGADVISMTGAAFSDWYRQDEWTAAVEFSAQGSNAFARAITMLGAGGTSVDEINMFILPSTGKAICSNTFTGGVSAGRVESADSYVLGKNTKAVLRIKSGERILAANGGILVTSNAAFTIPALTSMLIGSTSDGGVLNGGIARIRYWRKALPIGQLQRLSV